VLDKYTHSNPVYSDLFVSGVSTALGSDYVTRIFAYKYNPFSNIYTDRSGAGEGGGGEINI